MTIFRRRSRNSVHQSNGSRTFTTDFLEASASPSSAYFLADYDNKDNVIVDDYYNDRSPSASSEDTLSAESESEGHLHLRQSSEDSGLLSHTSNSSRSFAGMDPPEVLQEYSLRMDESEEEDDTEEQRQDKHKSHHTRNKSNVQLSLECPGVNSNDLNVQVNNGILQVRADVQDKESDYHELFEQSFQLDEQSLDIPHLTAQLEDGVLNITVPKKDDHQVTRLEEVPIQTHRPPKDKQAYRVIIDIPGVHREDIHVCYANGKLRISAHRTFGQVRSFKRTIPVDTQRYNADRLQTFLFRGQLTVLVPTKERRESFSKTIPVVEQTQSQKEDSIKEEEEDEENDN